MRATHGCSPGGLSANACGRRPRACGGSRPDVSFRGRGQPAGRAGGVRRRGSSAPGRRWLGRDEALVGGRDEGRGHGASGWARGHEGRGQDEELTREGQRVPDRGPAARRAQHGRCVMVVARDVGAAGRTAADGARAVVRHRRAVAAVHALRPLGDVDESLRARERQGDDGGDQAYGSARHAGKLARGTGWRQRVCASRHAV